MSIHEALQDTIVHIDREPDDTFDTAAMDAQGSGAAASAPGM